MSGKPRAQLFSMITLLIIVGLIYVRARDPQTWRWLAQDAAADDAEQEPRAKSTRANSSQAEAPGAEHSPAPQPRAARPSEVVVAGPTDLDPEELEGAARQFPALSDKSPLSPSEMPAYWRLMKWARAQTFDELTGRALRDVPFTQLWEQPDKYRGKPLRLRLHIKRILEYDAPQNPAGVERTYEAWGWTEDSKSYPYVVVFSELPPGMKTGSDVQEEGVFVGYFLKTMSYVAFDKTRAAPLLIGRLRGIDRPRTQKAGSGNDLWYWGAGLGLALLIGARLWVGMNRRPVLQSATHPAGGDLDVEAWLTKPDSTESAGSGSVPAENRPMDKSIRAESGPVASPIEPPR